MNTSGATLPKEPESYVYGGVLFQRVTESDSPQRPAQVGIGTCLAQGLLTGAIMTFVITFVVILSHPRGGYNFHFVLSFPSILSWGVVPGLAIGLIIGVCTKIAGHKLHLFSRAGLGAMTLAIPYAIFLFALLAGFSANINLMELFFALGLPGAIGAVVGLVTGSNLRLGRLLARGVDSVPPQSRFAVGFTGVVLRLSIIFFLMQSILGVLVNLQDGSYRDSVFALLALAHFIAAAVLAFGRFRFWILLPLAIIINVPLAGYIFQEFKYATAIFFDLGVVYFGAWALFLITRWQLTYKSLAYLREEIRYYLID